jgi:hypothetical protein
MSTATQIASSVNSLNLNTHSGGAVKTSSNIEFSRTLKNSMAQGASLTYQSVAPVAPFVPGGAIMSAMLHNTTAALTSEGIASGGAPMAAGAGLPGGAMPGAAGNGGMFQSMQQLQENMMSQNVYMLGLQQGFNDMNQKYTAISNVLKTKHDTEKNAISNFR